MVSRPRRDWCRQAQTGWREDAVTVGLRQAITPGERWRGGGVGRGQVRGGKDGRESGLVERGEGWNLVHGESAREVNMADFERRMKWNNGVLLQNGHSLLVRLSSSFEAQRAPQTPMVNSAEVTDTKAVRRSAAAW